MEGFLSVDMKEAHSRERSWRHVRQESLVAQSEHSVSSQYKINTPSKLKAWNGCICANLISMYKSLPQ